jgi:hypothetical protein
MVGFRHAGTITPPTQLGAHFQAAPAEEFKEKEKQYH